MKVSSSMGEWQMDVMGYFRQVPPTVPGASSSSRAAESSQATVRLHRLVQHTFPLSAGQLPRPPHNGHSFACLATTTESALAPTLSRHDLPLDLYTADKIAPDPFSVPYGFLSPFFETQEAAPLSSSSSSSSPSSSSSSVFSRFQRAEDARFRRDNLSAFYHLKWMRQKDLLAQDMFLLGAPGPLRRWLALHYCALYEREIEYVSLTRDSTESDLKQRREIVLGGTSVFVDQGIVRAAIYGRVLILEGLEKAERNVLPVLNNLLENREMTLEDGRFLMEGSRFDAMHSTFASPASSSTATAQAVRVHPRFRVIAIGVPVPPFAGNPLDPPLRSRFQARRVNNVDTLVLLHVLSKRLCFDVQTLSSLLNGPSDSQKQALPLTTAQGVVQEQVQVQLSKKLEMAAQSTIHSLVSCAEALQAVGGAQSASTHAEQRDIAYLHLPNCGEAGLLSAVRLLSCFPQASASDLLSWIYPHKLAVLNSEAQVLVQHVLQLLFPSLSPAAASTSPSSSPSSSSPSSSPPPSFSPSSAPSSAGFKDDAVDDDVDNKIGCCYLIQASVRFSQLRDDRVLENRKRQREAHSVFHSRAMCHDLGDVNAVSAWQLRRREREEKQRKVAIGCNADNAQLESEQPGRKTDIGDQGRAARNGAQTTREPLNAATDVYLCFSVVSFQHYQHLLSPAASPSSPSSPAAFSPASSFSPPSSLSPAQIPHRSHFVRVPGGGGSLSLPAPYTAGVYHQRLLSSLLMSHAASRDICLIGDKGEGKTFLVTQFAAALGYTVVEPLCLYHDMGARDLLQKRSTTSDGQTTWQYTPLVEAMKHGRLAVLDGVHRLAPGTLSVLMRLLQERELLLPDGTMFMRPDRYAAAMQKRKQRSEEETERSRGKAAKKRNGESSGLQKEKEKEKDEPCIYPIHPSFRIIALALPPVHTNPWLTHELIHLFHFHHVQFSESPQIHTLLSHLYPNVPRALTTALSHFARRTRELQADHLNEFKTAFSLRQMLRVLQRHSAPPSPFSSPSTSPASTVSTASVSSVSSSVSVSSGNLDFADIYHTLSNVCMLHYLPLPIQALLSTFLSEVGLEPKAKVEKNEGVQKMKMKGEKEGGRGEKEEESRRLGWTEKGGAVEGQTMVGPVVVEGITLAPDEQTGLNRLTICAISVLVKPALSPALVPDVVFYPIPQHVRLLGDLLLDLVVLDQHLLLIGNQGVGKNKLTDYLLQLCQLEREYVQLHRDTTVQSLILTPSLEKGVITFHDSPLVRAMKWGRVLMIDEVDKASTEVVCALKALLEDGEVLLTDNRRFVSPKSPLYFLPTTQSPIAASTAPSSSSSSSDLSRIYRIAPGFRVIALANPPGYPFLGNDFFAEMGDCFACHAIDNPDQESEIALLSAYGPSVPASLLLALTSSFAELRRLHVLGQLAYPYSTRELIHIVKHLHSFPADGIKQVLRNMLSFDSFDPDMAKTLKQVFFSYGIVV